MKRLFRFITKLKRFVIESFRTIINIFKYGPSAPRFNEIIWVDPKKIKMGLHENVVKKYFGFKKCDISGSVVHSTWPEEQSFHLFALVDPIVLKSESKLTWEDSVRIRIQSCIDHWGKGIPWDQTMAYKRLEKKIKEKGSFEGCKTHYDISKRYEKLDQIFDQVKAEGRLRLKKESDFHLTIKKNQEAIIHIGPMGELYYGGGSTHRFAIAYILNLPFPSRVGVVHIKAIPILKQLRK